MQLEEIRNERKKWFEWKNIKPLKERLESLKEYKVDEVRFDDRITIKGVFDQEIEEVARLLKPWRKGPFEIGNLFIDSEWQSFIKYNLLKPHLHLENKIIGDIGCNNGYYMFRMLEEKPKKIVGFDPSPLFNLQFDFINRFIKSDITYELLGVEHTAHYFHTFDTLFCLGVLYHRSDPISTLKTLKQSLNPGGELILDTFIIEGDEPIALSPMRYAKMKNIYFIPTLKTLQNWCESANFKNFELLEIKATDLSEQRKTDWIEGESLNNFLNEDRTMTIEGHPAPLRAYVRVSL